MKINNKFLGYLIAAGLVLSTASCSEDKLDEIDTNPNSPVDVPVNLLMPQVIVDYSFAIHSTDLAWYSSVFVQHTAGVHAQLMEADRRIGLTNATFVNNTWGTIYAGTLPDLNVIIEKGSEGGQEAGKNIHVGIAKILKACTMAIATDSWGRVPYSEAGQGVANRQPKYDDQQFIYTEIQKLLDEAIADLAKGGPSPGETDLLYGGDAGKWTKAAYSLKARYYNRLSNVDTESATKALDAASKGFTSPADNLVFDKFTTQSTGQNPWFQESQDRVHLAVSETFVQKLRGLNDPRLPLMVAPAGDSGEINGAPNGTQTDDAGNTEFSDPTSLVLNETSSIPLMTYDELQFIVAEANLRLNRQAEAYTAFKTAVTEAMKRQAGISETSITAYLGQAAMPAAASLTLKDVINQKWISFWLFQPIEAFADYRRTNFPELTHQIGPAPRRFPYVQSEIDANGANVPNVQLSNGVWWDDSTED